MRGTLSSVSVGVRVRSVRGLGVRVSARDAGTVGEGEDKRWAKKSPLARASFLHGRSLIAVLEAACGAGYWCRHVYDQKPPKCCFPFIAV
jgi:hypothetical protein